MRYFQVLGGGLLLLIAVLVGRALMLTPPPATTSPTLEIQVDGAAIARHLSESIQFETISKQAPETLDPAIFEAFIEWASRTYPEFHQKLERERVGTYSLLYTWTGSDPALAPILLTGHDDVAGFHGTNERISIENLERATRFYLRLIQRSAGNDAGDE
jgi:carboxypeptidase PM20D1